MLLFFSRIKKLINKVMSDSITKKKDKIQSILNVFETGKPDGDYSNVTIFSDGPKGIRQITYGKSQTTEWGNLNKLIKSSSVFPFLKNCLLIITEPNRFNR